MRLVTSLLIMAGLAGCVSVDPPPQQVLDSKPVMTLGAKPYTTSKDYILFIPARRDVRLAFKVAGDVFAADSKTTTIVRMNQGLYLYRQWASYDKKRWVHFRRLFKFNVQAGFNQAGGQLALTVSEQQP